MRDVQKQLKDMRTLVQEMGWSQFMSHVGSLMAEQSDKTSGRQSSYLNRCSTLLHWAEMRANFEACGHFTYPPEMVHESGKKF
jgi:hypothetical protein